MTELQKLKQIGAILQGTWESEDQITSFVFHAYNPMKPKENKVSILKDNNVFIDQSNYKLNLDLKYGIKLSIYDYDEHSVVQINEKQIQLNIFNEGEDNILHKIN